MPEGSMRVFKGLAIAMVSAWVMAAATPASAVSCAGAPSEVSQQMLAKVNAERKRAGLRPLAFDQKLARAAQGHACDMA
jgi:uncharacterized protein YkwD